MKSVFLSLVAALAVLIVLALMAWSYGHGRIDGRAEQPCYHVGAP